MILKFLIEFDGTDFAGWQRQINAKRTVQGVFESAFQQILQQNVTVIGAGRTDAGVHATGMVAHAWIDALKIPLPKLMLALNSLLPHDVQILSFEEAPPNFHARYRAVSRSYRYRLERHHHPLDRRYAWTPSYEWDDEVIRKAVSLLPGRHSFKSFCIQRPGEEGYFCTVSQATWETSGDGVNFDITADRFLHKMVRGLVGALIDLGRGRYTLEEFSRLLSQPQQNGSVFVAPPHGLTLVRVDYPDS